MSWKWLFLLIICRNPYFNSLKDLPWVTFGQGKRKVRNTEPSPSVKVAPKRWKMWLAPYFCRVASGRRKLKVVKELHWWLIHSAPTSWKLGCKVKYQRKLTETPPRHCEHWDCICNYLVIVILAGELFLKQHTVDSSVSCSFNARHELAVSNL